MLDTTRKDELKHIFRPDKTTVFTEKNCLDYFDVVSFENCCYIFGLKMHGLKMHSNVMEAN